MSSGSDSDEEYVPGEPEQLSEEGSADEETDLQFEKEQEIKATKRKAAATTTGKKRLKKTRNAPKEPTPEPEKPEKDEEKDPEEEKKREEDLWAMFLDGTDTKPKSKVEPATPKLNTSTNESTKTLPDAKTVTKPEESTKKKEDDAKSTETRIFEFAGETIVVENNIIKEKIKTSESKATASASPLPAVKGRASGGLSSVLGQLNKKNKLSTLDKSKLDWETYKKEAGVGDEVQMHNKGKQGYLERQDFLQRADLRQYEIERELRTSRRSNR